MAIYKCTICGMIYDEQEQGKPLSSLDACPICKQPISKFEKNIGFENKTKYKDQSDVRCCFIKRR